MSDAAPLGWLLQPGSQPAPGVVLRAGIDLSRVDLESMRREDLVVHVAGDAYLPRDLARLRSARVAALRTLVPRGRVVGLLAAAWAHGVEAEPDPVEVLVPRSVASARPADGVRERESPVPPRDVVEVCGLRLTSPARTAADVARWLPVAIAAPVLAALLAAGTEVEDVLAVLGRRYRNAVRGRALVLAVSRGGGR
jgi:AbiEi antitoxin C-terminal domain